MLTFTQNITDQRAGSPTAPTTKSFCINNHPDTSLVTKPVQIPTHIEGGKVQTQPHPTSRHNVEKIDGMAVSGDEIDIVKSLAETEAEKKRLTIVNQTSTRRIKSLENQLSDLRVENESLHRSYSEKMDNLAKSFAVLQRDNELLRAQLEEAYASHAVQQPQQNQYTHQTQEDQRSHHSHNSHQLHSSQQAQKTRNAPEVHHTHQSEQTQQNENLLHPHIQIAEDDITQNSQLTRISHTGPIQPHTQNTRDAQPDIARPTLSSAARHVLDGLCPHNQQNCGLCASIISSKTTTHPTVTIPHRIPVSQRMRIDEEHYEDDATLRPSQSPRLALEKVIKGIEDEIEHLKLDCAQLQSEYYNLDVSVGKRQRKGMKAGIARRMEVIERKSDQLYDLYDVLEGL
jgi:hypothetical protein